MLFINFLMIKDTTFGKTMKDLDFNQCSSDGLTNDPLALFGRYYRRSDKR